MINKTSEFTSTGGGKVPVGKTFHGRYQLFKLTKEILDTYGDAYVEVNGRGKVVADNYFTQHYRALGYDRKGYKDSEIYTLVDIKLGKVVGFFGISCADMHIPKVGTSGVIGTMLKYVLGREAGEDYIRGRKAFGAISLDYFALCHEYQGKIMCRNISTGEPVYFSEYLMYRCLDICEYISSLIGVNLVMLHSTDAGLNTYYRFGFEFMYEADFNYFIKEYPAFKSKPKQCVNSAFKYVTSRSNTEDACYPMVFKI